MLRPVECSGDVGIEADFLAGRDIHIACWSTRTNRARRDTNWQSTRVIPEKVLIEMDLIDHFYRGRRSRVGANVVPTSKSLDRKVTKRGGDTRLANEP